MLVQVAVLAEEAFFDGGEGEEEGLVVSFVEAADQTGQWGEVDWGFGFLGCGRRAEGRQVNGGGRWRWGRGRGVFHLFVAGAGTGGRCAGEGGEFVVAVAEDGADFGGVDDFGLEVDALEGHGAGEDGVDDEGGVGAEFVAGEGGEGVEEEGGGEVVGAGGEEVEALVGL